MKIFITGGSRGIGHHLMTTALSKGHEVAFTYCNPNTDVEDLLKQAREIASEKHCKGYQLDVQDSAQVVKVADQVADDFGTLDVIVNNAGINDDGMIFNMSDDQWHTVLNTNLTGSFYVIRQFLPVLLANQGGRFIHLSSIAKEGIAGQANYSASKAGLVGLSNTVAKEYGAKGITSNVVVPGVFDTDMTRQTLSDDLKGFWLQHCPARRMGRLEELSETILFLASGAAGFVNGQVISVTGGLDWAG